MPELPDIQAYLTALETRVLHRTLTAIRIGNPFLLRSISPPVSDAEGRRVLELRRLGKRLVFGLEHDLFLVLHLMVAGRLRWKQPGAKLPGRSGLAAFDFANGTLVLTEAGSKRRASLFLVDGETGLAEHDRGGLEVLAAELDQFRSRLQSQRHTLKRSLTDPRLFSGIGNAYSDEILHRAKLSPFKVSTDLSDAEYESLYAATQETLSEWIDRFTSEAAERFPEKVTAFRPEMAVHGRFGKPCPVCGAPVQRIVYAENEANYCAGCQTGGRIMADRMLSRLLKDDWPRRLEDLEK
jgi:formamidopyrimidine-DNA glycosylase